MAVPTTWEELKAELATLAIRDDLEDLIPNFVGYAENWFQRELFSPEREASTALVVADGVADLPSDFAGVRTVYVDGSTDTVLVRVSPDRIRAMYPTTAADTPLHYAIEGETMLFGPAPSSGLIIKLVYIEGVPTLGSGQATNWLLTDHPDLYVNASLAELYDYTRDYDEADRRRTKALAIAGGINRFSQRRKGNSGPLVARAASTDAVLSYR